MNEPFPMEYLVVPLVFLFVMFIIAMVLMGRWRRDHHRLELQKAILERVSSVKDLGEFLTTEDGQRFLTSLSPSHFRPQRRSLLTVRIGVVLLTIGVFMMVALHSNFFPSYGGNSPAPLLLATLLLIAAGIGMLLSAIVSFLIAHSLRLLDRRSNGSGKGSAV